MILDYCFDSICKRSSVTLDEAGVDFDAIDLSKWFISGEGDIGDNIDHDDLTFWSGSVFLNPLKVT